MFSKKKMTPAAVGVVAIAAALLVTGGAPAVAQNNGTTAIVHFYDVTPALTTDATVTTWGTFNTLSGSSASADTAITCPSASTGAYAFISLASRANSATTPASWEGWKFIRTLTTNKSLSNINVSPSTFTNGKSKLGPKSGGNYYLGIACTSVNGTTVDAAYYRSITTVSPNGSYSTTDNPTRITAAPSSLAAGTATSTSVPLTWSAPSVLNGGTIVDYVVEYRLSSASQWNTFNHTSSTTPSITVTDLTAATGYDFRVAAQTLQGTSTYSSTVSKTTAAASSGITAAPSALAARPATLTSVSLTWTAPSVLNDGVITDYVVQYRATSSSSWLTYVHAASTSAAITVSGLTAGTSYTFQVAAKTQAGTSPFATSVIRITASGITTAPRTLATSTTTRNSVKLTWTAPQTLNDGTVTDYKVQYRLSTSTAWLTFTEPVTAVTGATVTGLTPNKTYQFQVSAKTAQGYSVYTATVSKLTLRSK